MVVEPIPVREHGNHGPTAVVLHGGPGAQGSVTSLAAALAPTCRVLEPMQRRSGTVPLSVLRHVEDLAEVAPPEAIYVGWSWGAMLGLSFASLHPEKVTSLVLVGCGTYDEASRAEYGRRLGQRLGPEGRTRLEDLEARLARATDPQWRDDLLGQIGELTERASSVDPTASLAGDTHPDAVGHKETWDNVLDLQRRCVEPARFVGVLCPVLMLHGDEDPHPGHAIADSLRPYIPQLAFLGLPRCGHVPWYERHGREPFMRDLRQWIEDVG